MAMFSLLVFAADIPEAVPAGFLEQLPVMLEMRNNEYEALLEFVESQNDVAEQTTNGTEDTVRSQESEDEN